MRFVQGTPAKEGSTLVGMIAPNAGTADGERSDTRTPMQWDQSKNDGFSTAESDALYLPMDHDPDRPTVQKQESDPDSLLNFVRKLVALRIEHPALGADGDFQILNETDTSYQLAHTRALDNTQYLIATNPKKQSQTLTLSSPIEAIETILDGGAVISDEGTEITVEAFGYAIYRIQ